MNKIDWAKFSIEGMVIVISILLAFSIEAWWQRYQQEEDRLTLLESLGGDIEDKQRFFNGNRRYNQEIYNSTISLYEIAISDNSNASNEEIEKLLAGMYWKNTPNQWSSAALSTTLTDSGVALIADQELIQNLVDLQDDFSRLQGYTQSDNEFFDSSLAPFLRRNANFGAWPSPEHMPGIPSIEINFPDFSSDIEFDHQSLLTNLEFQNLVYERAVLIDEILGAGYGNIAIRLTNILNAIDKELN